MQSASFHRRDSAWSLNFLALPRDVLLHGNPWPDHPTIGGRRMHFGAVLNR
jgi:hypothetical protein